MLPRHRLAGYAVGSIGTAIFTTVPSLLLLYYLTDVLGVAAAVAGLVLVLPKVWDAVLNPLVGSWSDAWASRRGSRTRWLVAGAVALPPAFALMFAAPSQGDLGAALWVGGFFVLAATAFTLFQVPYVSLPAEMSERHGERTRLVAWRMVCLALGILVAGAAAPTLADGLGGDRAAYAVMGACLGAVMGIAMLAAARGTRWVRSRRERSVLRTRQALALAAGNRGFRMLLAAFGVQSIGVMVMLAGSPYVASYWLGDPALTAALFAGLVGPLLVVTPLWRLAAMRFGKVRCLVTATVAFAAITLSMVPTLQAGATAVVVLQAALLGSCYSALQLMPFSLLPDVVVEDVARSGRRQAGAFTGIWMGVETAGAAIGPGIYAGVLALGRFRASPADEPITQPASAETAVLVGFAVVPVVLLAASLPLLARFARLRLRAVPASSPTTP